MDDVRHDDFHSKRGQFLMTYRRIADLFRAKFNSFVDCCYQVDGLARDSTITTRTKPDRETITSAW